MITMMVLILYNVSFHPRDRTASGQCAKVTIVGLILIDRHFRNFKECISMDLSNAARCCPDV